MEELRGLLGARFATSAELASKREGDQVLVAGMVVRLQHPAANAYFITLEDEEGLIPLILWPGVYDRYKGKVKETFLLASGTEARRIAFNLIRPGLSCGELDATVNDFLRREGYDGEDVRLHRTVMGLDSATMNDLGSQRAVRTAWPKTW